ncbi:MAG: hypothetical protein ABSH34_06560 [Verrucomicrobiota bacterium]
MNPNSELLSANEIPSRSPAPAPGLGRDQLTLGSTEDLNRALQQTPLARPEEVARATGLVRDASYPPMAVIDNISGLLALHLNTPDPSQQSG